MKRPSLGVSLLVVAAAVQAQPAAPARPDPLDARAPVPASAYSSPFASYRPFVTQSPGIWRDMNDEVARIGGWKAYAREAYEAAQAAERPAPAVRPVTGAPGATPPKR